MTYRGDSSRVHDSVQDFVSIAKRIRITDECIYYVLVLYYVVTITTVCSVYCTVVCSVEQCKNFGKNAGKITVWGPSVREKSMAISVLFPHVLRKKLAPFPRSAEFSVT